MTDLIGANMAKASLVYAKLAGASLVRTNLRFATLTGAILTNSTRSGAFLSGTSFDLADLSWGSVHRRIGLHVSAAQRKLRRRAYVAGGWANRAI